MSTKKVVKNKNQGSHLLTLASFGFVVVAVPVFILLSFYAYTLVFLGTDTATIVRGVAILAAMVISLGFVLFNRRKA